MIGIIEGLSRGKDIQHPTSNISLSRAHKADMKRTQIDHEIDGAVSVFEGEDGNEQKREYGPTNVVK